jgi:hypothetical protein
VFCPRYGGAALIELIFWPMVEKIFSNNPSLKKDAFRHALKTDGLALEAQG